MEKKKFSVSECPLFAGLDEAETEAALVLLRARRERCAKGAILALTDGYLPRFGLVTAGSVHICQDGADGEHFLMAAVTVGQTFGESLAYLRRKTAVYPQAAAKCEILWMDPAALREETDDPLTRTLQRNFAAMLARRTLVMNDRIQIMSRRSLRDKILALIEHYGADAPGRIVTLPFDRAGMAFYLGADRSALSRELGRMKSEGIIDFDRNAFSLKAGRKG